MTVPSCETVATDGVSLDQITVLSDAFSGSTVAVSFQLSPGLCKTFLVLSSVIPVTGTTESSVTFTVQVAVWLPSFVVAVIVALPAPNAFTTPLVTVATVLSLLDHVTSLLAALDGDTVAVSVSDAPCSSDRLVLFRVTPDTCTTESVTVTVHLAV